VDVGDAVDAAEITSTAGSQSSSDTEEDDADEEVLEEDVGEELVLVPPQVAPAPKHTEEKRQGSKSLDPVSIARRRVRLRLREEVKAARKARRRERAREKKRKGVGINLDDFLTRTRERLGRHQDEAHATQLESSLAEASSSELARRGRGMSVEEFTAKTQMRLQARIKAAQAAIAGDEARRAAREIEASAAVEAFQKETQARIVQRLFSLEPPMHGRRRRIGIVGAGPVGLWAAYLIARKYSQVGEHRRHKRADAPMVTVLESRPPEAHGLRHDVRIALSSNTQKLLNHRTKSTSFVSGMALAGIEAELQGRWRLAAKASVEFGANVLDPAKLCKDRGFDCILWTAGRRSLEQATRAPLGCEQQIGDCDQVLVFQLGKLQGVDPWQHGGDLTGPVRQAAGMPSLRIMLRPGFGGQCSCWLWLFGLPKDAKSTFNHAGTKAMQQSIPEAVAATIARDNPYWDCFRKAAEYLQGRLKPDTASLRWVEASYWSSDRSVVDLGCLDETVAGVPLVLLGDAASGKPFYTGTTLNKHLWDVDELIGEVRWCRGSLLDGLEAHERRYQTEIRRLPAFRRPQL